MTSSRGDPMGLIIETNGSTLSYEQIDKLEDDYGEDARRIVVAIGIKSTTPEGLAELTGLSLSVAERAHERQLENILYIALRKTHVGMRAVFLDKYTDLGMYAALQREVERKKPGRGRLIEMVPFKRFGNANRYYTPKRFRENIFPDGIPEVDEEVINGLLDKEGKPGKDWEGEGFEGEELEELRMSAEEIADQELPEGRMNDG